MALDLASGVTVQVAPPVVPPIQMGPPVAPPVTVVPVAGPQGPQGIPGSPDQLGFVYSQSGPTRLWQIQHGLPYNPAGVVALDTTGTPIEYDAIAWPQTGVVELTFGAPVAGTVYIS